MASTTPATVESPSLPTTLSSAGITSRHGTPSPVHTLIVLLSTLGVLVYSAFLLNPQHRGDVIPYVMVLTAESVLVFHALLSMWTILAGANNPRDFTYYLAQNTLFPKDFRGHAKRAPFMINGAEHTIDVFITTCGEDVDVIKRTVKAAIAMRGRHNTWVLDALDNEQLDAVVNAAWANGVPPSLGTTSSWHSRWPRRRRPPHGRPLSTYRPRQLTTATLARTCWRGLRCSNPPNEWPPIRTAS